MKKRSYIWFVVFLILLGCSTDDGAKLPSVEERVNAAIEELREELVEPVNGWRLAYRPTSHTGTFLVLLDFNTDGTVRVQSDVTVNNGEFRDQVIAYRIDSSQGIELIMETYGVFHYFFELQQGSFGGEFEFVFDGKEGDNLHFKSKSDGGSDVTDLIFIPASGSESISNVSPKTLSQGHFQSENLGGIGSFGIFNFHLQDYDFTLSAVFDLRSRTIKLLGIAEGADMSAVVSNKNVLEIDAERNFSFQNEQIILDQPIGISFNGNSFDITKIPVGEAVRFQESFCPGKQDSVTRFSAMGTELGTYESTSSLFQVSNRFKTSANDVYAINHVFIYDENDNSISNQIEAVFPDVVAFQWYHGVEIADSVFNGVGFVTVDEFNNVEFFLRGYDFTQSGNYLQITFNGNDLITDDNPTQSQLDGLEQLTDQLFSGGEMYVIELLNIDGLYEFYNPCNKYKGFLF